MNVKYYLNLGSGFDKPSEGKGLTLDRNQAVKPDICHDLNHFPWPLSDGQFDLVYCKDILEHLHDFVKVMEEIHRVSKSGAEIIITTPHYSCSNSFADPTHCHHLSFFSFDYITGENQWSYYSDKKFRKKEAFIHFQRNFKNKLIWRLANRYPKFYEEHLAWIFPAWFMHFRLEVIK